MRSRRTGSVPSPFGPVGSLTAAGARREPARDLVGLPGGARAREVVAGERGIRVEQRPCASQVVGHRRVDQRGGASLRVERDCLDVELQTRPRAEPVLARNRQLRERDRRELPSLAPALGFVAQVAKVRTMWEGTRLGHVSSFRSSAGPHAGPKVTSVTGDSYDSVTAGPVTLSADRVRPARPAHDTRAPARRRSRRSRSRIRRPDQRCDR